FNDLDLLTGYEFEEFVEELFTKMGYLSTRTKGSGDQGIDVLAEKDGRKFGIQTKCYGSKVNNSAVQETVAGIAYYNCDRGIVITNNYFTKSAVDLAAKNDIILWDRNMLREKFDEYM
ncbi:restriction endonuclease, partial [Sporosarcina sp. BP05]|uniref:restriction endonuclease n=1 Tax=Sporosarcina sp. BP05 TaxID=2758726 RepID=UPI001648FF6C